MSPTRAEHYVALRTQAHELRHQAELHDYVNRRAPALNGDVKAAVDEYFESFRQRCIDTQQGAEMAMVELRKRLPSMTSQERREAEAQIPVPLYPAWSAKDEEGYLRTYGDPRDDPSLLTFVTMLDSPVWNEIIDGRNVERVKTNWEKTLLTALLVPQDGSVPVYKLDESGQPVIETRAILGGRSFERPRQSVGTEPGVGVEDPYASNPTMERPHEGGAVLPQAQPTISTLPPVMPPMASSPSTVAEPLPVAAAVAETEYEKAVRKAMELAANSICPGCAKSFTALGAHKRHCKALKTTEPAAAALAPEPVSAA